MISDFKNKKNILRTNARERSDLARGSEATERGKVVPPPTVGRFFNFGGQNHVIWCMQYRPNAIYKL